MNLAEIRCFELPEVTTRYSSKDTILYALGLGYGAEAAHLPFVYEAGLQAVPSICVVLGHPGFWARDPKYGISWLRLLHGEQAFEIHRPIAPSGSVRAAYEIPAVEDRGQDTGAILHMVKHLYDDDANELVASVRTTLFLRGDGGCGGFGVAPAALRSIPEGRALSVVDLSISYRAAAIYRLSGDFNPIHIDPGAAEKAGFARPILHGLCSMGFGTRAVISTFCEGDASRLLSMSVRFSKPVYPGETLRFEFFEDGAGSVRFRALALERGVTVLDRGTAKFTQTAKRGEVV